MQLVSYMFQNEEALNITMQISADISIVEYNNSDILELQVANLKKQYTIMSY